MQTTKHEIVIRLFGEIYDDLDEIFEMVMDEEPHKVIEIKIDETVRRLKELKESVIKKIEE